MNTTSFFLLQALFELKEYNFAHYNLGYSHFKLKQYTEAIPWFRKYRVLPQMILLQRYQMHTIELVTVIL